MHAPQIDPEFKKLIRPLDTEEARLLEESIVAQGCLDTLKTWKGILVDGHHRLEICNRLGKPYRTKELDGFEDRAAVRIWILGNQLGRRNLSPFERVEIVDQRDEEIRTQANKKKKAGVSEDGGAGGRGRKKTIPQNCGKVSKHERESSGQLAKQAKVSARTYDKARELIKKAPEAVKEKLRRGETTIHAEYKAIRKQETKAEAQSKIEKHQQPNGRYHVIVMDPPWQYTKRSEDPTHRAACPYPQMTDDEIKAMKVADLCEEDCILWIWTTNAHMRAALEISAAYGFEQKTILTWAKNKMGTGDWLRGQTEHCLMCVRGKPVVNLTNQTTLLHADVREHSRKPDEFYQMVDQLCIGKKLEMFAREQRAGWTCSGAENGKFGS